MHVGEAVPIATVQLLLQAVPSLPPPPPVHPALTLTRIRVGAEPMPAAQDSPVAVAPPGSYRICSAAGTAHRQYTPRTEWALSGAQATACVLWSACTSSWLATQLGKPAVSLQLL